MKKSWLCFTPMPELPEVEILVRHLAPLLKGRKIRQVEVRRAKVLGATSERELSRTLQGATFTGLSRRGKFLVFELRRANRGKIITLVGHLGMTGRMYLLPKASALPKHAAVVLDFDGHRMVYEDTRYFGRFTLDRNGLEKLGPEPLGPEFTVEHLARALKRSGQPIKIKLLDQSLVAGVGNIYASEALFQARISPRLAANKLDAAQVRDLRRTMRKVLAEAIRRGSTLPLDFGKDGERNGLFYYGSAEGASDFYQERLLVYDRQGRPCVRCRTPIKRVVQGARSTFYCPSCQRSSAGKID
jgi:formamidopyrimidine-DNA glycosylase